MEQSVHESFPQPDGRQKVNHIHISIADTTLVDQSVHESSLQVDVPQSGQAAVHFWSATDGVNDVLLHRDVVNAGTLCVVLLALRAVSLVSTSVWKSQPGIVHLSDNFSAIVTDV